MRSVADLQSEQDRISYLIGHFSYIKSKSARDLLMEMGVIRNAIAFDSRVITVLRHLGFAINERVASSEGIYAAEEERFLRDVCKPLRLEAAALDRLIYRNYDQVLTKLGGRQPADAVTMSMTKKSSASVLRRSSAHVIARLVIDGEPPAVDLRAARAKLLKMLKQLGHDGMKAKFLVTPGGFVECPFPHSWEGCGGWGSRPADLELITDVASKAVNRVVTNEVLDAAQGKVRVITVGVDVWSKNLAAHAELVAVFDVAKRRLVRWTGKSYPTIAQERTLVQVADLRSHLVEVAGERVLVLGCHDLNMWSPRAWASQDKNSPRRRRCREMRALARQFMPTIVVQHPHSTDTPRIWALGWAGIRRHFPALKAWASAIAYVRWTGRRRASLAEVLEGTKSSDSIVWDSVVS
ncbi:MAG: hypothetical protein NFCOHLIN_01096 [Gammaproteobacteria bacterium]|nr:hypothetical protein [Gammaproteobacteria bacterium]